MGALRGAFKVSRYDDTGDAAVTALVCPSHAPAYPYLTLVLAPELAHEMARQLVDVAGPDPVIEQRVAIEVHDQVKAQSRELIESTQLATLAMVRRALANHDGGAFTQPGLRAAVRLLDDVIDSYTSEAGDR